MLGCDVRRWLNRCGGLVFLPAAVAGGAVAQFAAGLVGQFLRSGLGVESGTDVAFAVQLILHGMTAGAFVVAGGFMAPRLRGGTALVLAIIGALLSLLKHVLLQLHPGWVNYCHLGAEALGGLAAAGWVWGRGRGDELRIDD